MTFEVRQWWQRRKAETSLRYPLAEIPRIAVVGLRVGLPAKALWVASATSEELGWFQPDAVACSFDELAAMPAEVRAGLRMPLVLFRFPETGLLSPEQRDWVWQRFGLPLYEQLRTKDGVLLAHECDAHDGLHWVAEDTAGFALQVDTCLCGWEGRMLRPGNQQVETSAA